METTWHRAVAALGGLLVAGLALTACAGGATGGASASCAAPTIELGDSTLEPGGEVQLSVEWMTQSCEDTGGTNRAAEDVTVSLVGIAGGESVVLGRPEPTGPRYTVSGTFDLPDDLAVGPATLRVASTGGDETSAEAPVTITPAA